MRKRIPQEREIEQAADVLEVMADQVMQDKRGMVFILRYRQTTLRFYSGPDRLRDDRADRRGKLSNGLETPVHIEQGAILGATHRDARAFAVRLPVVLIAQVCVSESMQRRKRGVLAGGTHKEVNIGELAFFDIVEPPDQSDALEKEVPDLLTRQESGQVTRFLAILASADQPFVLAPRRIRTRLTRQELAQAESTSQVEGRMVPGEVQATGGVDQAAAESFRW